MVCAICIFVHIHLKMDRKSNEYKHVVYQRSDKEPIRFDQIKINLHEIVQWWERKDKASGGSKTLTGFLFP